jgi:hypothetical protein
MRKEGIVSTFCKRQWIHPANTHKLLDCKFSREAEKVPSDSFAPRLLTRAVPLVENLSGREVAARCFPHVLRIRHC